MDTFNWSDFYTVTKKK